VASDFDKNILEPLQIALKLEREGKQFFAEAAQRCEGELPRQTFRFLAEEEERHIEHIERFYNSLVDSPDAGLPDLDEGATKERFQSLRSRLSELQDSLAPSISDKDAYKTAIRFENGAEDLYREQIEKSDNPAVRAFYEWLIREEERHARFLRDCLRFAEDPSGWFKENSSD
jgi:rubrerythrin